MTVMPVVCGAWAYAGRQTGTPGFSISRGDLTEKIPEGGKSYSCLEERKMGGEGKPFLKALLVTIQ